MIDYFLARQYIFPYVAIQHLLYTAEKRDLNRRLAEILLVGFCAGLILLYPRKILAAVQYSGFILLLYRYSLRFSSVLFSYTYTMFATHFGAWVYELPYWHEVDMFYNSRYPFYVNSQILSGIALVYLLYHQGFKFNRSVVYGLVFFVLYEILFTVRVLYYRFVICDMYLLSRVGMMVLMFCLLKGVKKDEYV